MKSVSFTHPGQRQYQEDYFYDNIAGQGLYILCDGVGGAAKGAEASQLVTRTICEMVEDKGVLPIGKAVVHQLITAASTALKKKVEEMPGADGMGTTLTMVFFHEAGATLAHIGDSRIYYIKPESGKYWRTKDHSQVQELFDAGILKSEAAMATHPMNNRITRALQGKIEEGNLGEKKVTAEVINIDNLEEGDLFFMCSDGVLEAYLLDSFIDILTNSELELEERLAKIKLTCAEKSKDNNTAILIEVEETEMVTSGTNDDLSWRQISMAGTDISNTLKPSRKTKAEIKNDQSESVANFKESDTPPSKRNIFILVALLTLGILGFFFLYGKKEKNKPSNGIDSVDVPVESQIIAQAERPVVIKEKPKVKSNPTPKTTSKPKPVAQMASSTKPVNGPNTGAIESNKTDNTAEAEISTESEAILLSTESPATESIAESADNPGDVLNIKIENTTEPELETQKPLQENKPEGESSNIKPKMSVYEKISKNYKKVEKISNGMYAVSDGEFWGFCNEKGVLIIDHDYKSVLSFSKEVACVLPKWKNGKWIFIDKNGKNAFDKDMYFDTGVTFTGDQVNVVKDKKHYRLKLDGTMTSL